MSGALEMRSVGVERRERAPLSAPQGRPVLVAPHADLTYAGSPHSDHDDREVQ